MAIHKHVHHDALIFDFMYGSVVEKVKMMCA